MNALLSVKSGQIWDSTLVRWSRSPVVPVVVGLLLAACGGDNEPPWSVVDTLPTTKVMTEMSWQEYDVDVYFRDPDLDSLSFTASIDDSTVATATLKQVGDSLRLVVAGLTGGKTMVTLTATDPHGGEAQVAGQVLVVEPVLFWRDDFDSDNGEWSFGGTYSFDRREGFLAAMNGAFGGQRRELDYAVDWMVSVAVAAEEGSNNQTIGYWFYTHGTARLYVWATVGGAELYRYISGAVTPSNWQIVWCCGYTWWAGGMSDAVGAIGEVTEMHWAVRFGRVELIVGETLLWSQVATEEDWPSNEVYLSLFGYAGGGETEQWMYFDWAELWGIPADGGDAELSGDWRLLEGPESLRMMSPAPVVSRKIGISAQ